MSPSKPFDVKKPPPELWLRDPQAYTKMVRNRSARVLLKTIRYSACPTLGRLHCAQSHQNALLLDLYAFAYHMFRATCHKPKYVIIAL